MNRVAVALGALFVVPAFGAPAFAEYPERPVKVIVPFSAGGGADTGSRLWGRYLEACLGGEQPVIIDNRPGAGGQIGFAALAQMPADGYALGALNFPNVPIGVITNPDAAYTMDSFDYLFDFYGSRTTLSVLRDSEIQSVKQLIDDARQSGQPVTVGISGVGSDDHMLTLKLEKLTGVEFTTIPLGDSAGANAGLLGGHVEVATLNTVGASTHADKVRALAVAAAEPVAALPDAPTFRQEGLDVVNGTTHVIGAPKGLPEDARAKLTGCFEQISKDPNFIAEVEKLGLLFAPMGPEETTDFAYSEYETLKSIWESDPWE